MDYTVTYVQRHDATTKHVVQFQAESDNEALWKLTENLDGIYPSYRDILVSLSSVDAWTPANLREAWTNEDMLYNIGDIYLISLKNSNTGKMLIDNIWPYRSDEVLDWPVKKQMPSAWEED